MKTPKLVMLCEIILLCVVVSGAAGAVEPTVFPNKIYIQKGHEGIVKIVEHFEKDMSVVHVQTGDLNGDGFGDVILGSRYSDANGLTDSGSISIVFGKENYFLADTIDAVSEEHALTIKGNEKNDYLGRTLSTGDLNGDGFDDLVFGANTCLINNETQHGNIYILLGNQGLSSHDPIDLRVPDSDLIYVVGDIELGSSAACGDIDGDGYDDIIIGAATTQGTGSTYIIKGSVEFETNKVIDLAEESPNIIKTLSGENLDCFGIYTASGDFNGDGYHDVAIGAREADTLTKRNCGKTYVIWGYKDFFLQERTIDLNALSQNVTVITGADENDYSGTLIETGNLDNDGCDELILESSRHNPDDRPQAGVVYIFKGEPSFSENRELELEASYPNLIKIYGRKENDFLGRCVIFDINNDGLNDILLNLQGDNESGETYLLTDENLWSQNLIELGAISDDVTTIYGNQPRGLLGFELRTCDVDGDGKNDLVMGSHDLPWAGGYSDGIAYIMSGAGVTAVPNQSYEVFAVDTGNSSTIVILDEHTPQLDGFPLEHGAEIGVFTLSGICAGVGIWDGNDLRITVWGDNPDTNDIEGFEEGERYCFHTQNEYQGEYTECSVSILSGDTEYAADDIVVISSLQFGVIVDVAEAAPISFSLDQNYPNPFNPVTTIPFTIPDAGHVELSVFDIRGARIGTLVDTVLSPGRHTAEWNAMAYPSGVYLYRLKTGTAVQSGKMLLIK